MKYFNPVISGFYPDPSVCTDGDKYYLVTSTFQYFPGVALFESDDLINWEPIGSVLTRESQLPLADSGASGGIYAPTIRYNDGTFYMVTTNVSAGGNFYVTTNDIHGEWSEPIFVEQGGIDPSLYFEGDKAYFMSNGEDDDGNGGITQCEIDIKTGKKLTKSKVIWQGAGGRYLESPHLYKINDQYYIMAAEGGTEYGHMVVYAKGDNINGPFENYAKNPVLTNRNLGGYGIQGCGHADLVQRKDGSWWMVHLAFRQLGEYDTYHTTGRETYLVPVNFDEDGWFTAGDESGTTRHIMEVDGLHASVEVAQPRGTMYSFANTKFGREWVCQKNPEMSNYDLSEKGLKLIPSKVNISQINKSPSMLLIRQKEMTGSFAVFLKPSIGESGVTVFMDELHHYDLAVVKGEKNKLILKQTVGPYISSETKSVELTDEQMQIISEDGIILSVEMSNYEYHFFADFEGELIDMGKAAAKYVSTEVAGGFTGVMFGLYAFCEQLDVKLKNVAEFSDLLVEYTDQLRFEEG